MSTGVNSRLLADRAMAIADADSSQVRINLFVEVDTIGVSRGQQRICLLTIFGQFIRSK